MKVVNREGQQREEVGGRGDRKANREGGRYTQSMGGKE